MIKFDANNTGMDPIKAGEYEVYANAFDVGFSQNGNERVQFNYFIREDVQQFSRGNEIRFDNFTLTENAAWKMNALMKAIGIQDGAEFPDMATWAQSMLGLPLRVRVELVPNQSGKVYPEVKQHLPSQAPNMQVQPVIKMNQQQNNRANQFGNMGPQQQQHSNQNYANNYGNSGSGPYNTPNNNSGVNISDDDLPF